MPTKKNAITAPPIARRWIRMLLGLTVSVGTGLAPLLGLTGIPLFSPLLGLFPIQIRNQAIILSTATMAIVAIWVQWQADSILKAKSLGKWFRLATFSTILSFVLLLVADNFLVVSVPYLSGSKTASFLRGFARPSPDKCSGLSDESCIINKLHFDTSNITDYWGDSQLNWTRLIFLLCYIALLSHIAVLVGLIVLREGKALRVSKKSKVHGRKLRSKSAPGNPVT
jgi:hypothetical protein